MTSGPDQWRSGVVATIPLDTHRVLMRLKERGFTEEQAAGIDAAMREFDLSQVATKADLRELELQRP